MRNVLLIAGASSSMLASRLMREATKGSDVHVVIVAEQRPVETRPAPSILTLSACDTAYTSLMNVIVHRGFEIDWPSIRRGFQAFLDFLYPPVLEPNPLPILMRAVNGLFLPLRTINNRAGARKGGKA